MLSRYLSYNLVEELLKSPHRIRLGGARQKVSVLFSDISGFTRLLSVVEPERVIQVLNEYLTEMTNIIFENGGMVDKYVGDAIIGIFGAPYTAPDDSLRAVRTALNMQERLRQLQSKWKQNFGEVITARIAVNTGEVILGNIGSPKRMDYTAIGDPVNIASRLQAIADVGSVVISKATYDENRFAIEALDLGKVELKGKEEPIDVFEVHRINGEDFKT
jgi:adenylate cyclase